MYHLRLKGTHYEMGKRRGQIFNKCGIKFSFALDEFQLKHGKESEILLQKYFPEIIEEIKGVCDEIKSDYLTFVSWMLCMGCCMYNLEKNIPMEVKGCTVFAFKNQNEIWYGRNNDLPPMLKKGCKSELYKPTNGMAFNITTSSFINGEEGYNEAGLAVGMTFVITSLENICPGFNSCFIVRYLLEKAHSTREAIELIKELPIASNCNILLCDQNGEMVIAECSPKEINIIKPINEDGKEYLCCVNDFSSEHMKKYTIPFNTYDSNIRYQTVINALHNYQKEPIRDYLEDTLKGKKGFICQYKKSLDFDTVWSTLINLKTNDIYRSEGNPKRTPYIIDERLKSYLLK